MSGMKLGKDTGSVTSYVLANSAKNDLPKVGDGVTIFHWTDREAGTVISVSENEVVAQEDTVIRTDKYGQSDTQFYDYFPNPDGKKWTIKKVRSGKFKGEWRLNGLKDGNHVMFGRRDYYFDYGF
jgi:hypothetical protein